MEITQISKLCELEHGAQVAICGTARLLRILTTRKGDNMGWFELQDSTGEVEVVVFPDMYLPNEELLKTCDDPICFVGDLDISEECFPKLIAHKVTVDKHVVKAMEQQVLDLDYRARYPQPRYL